MYVDQIYDLNETRNTLHTSSTSKSSNRRFSYSLNIIVAMDCSMTIFCSTTSNTISFIMIKDNMIIDGFFNNRFVDDNRFIIDRIARLLKNKNVLSWQKIIQMKHKDHQWLVFSLTFLRSSISLYFSFKFSINSLYNSSIDSLRVFNLSYSLFKLLGSMLLPNSSKM